MLRLSFCLVPFSTPLCPFSSSSGWTWPPEAWCGTACAPPLIASSYSSCSPMLDKGEETENDPLSSVLSLFLCLTLSGSWFYLWLNSSASSLVGCARGSLEGPAQCLDLGGLSQVCLGHPLPRPGLSSPPIAFWLQSPLVQLTDPLSGWEPARPDQPPSVMPT